MFASGFSEEEMSQSELNLQQARMLLNRETWTTNIDDYIKAHELLASAPLAIKTGITPQYKAHIDLMTYLKTLETENRAIYKVGDALKFIHDGLVPDNVIRYFAERGAFLRQEDFMALKGKYNHYFDLADKADQEIRKYVETKREMLSLDEPDDIETHD